MLGGGFFRFLIGVNLYLIESQLYFNCVIGGRVDGFQQVIDYTKILMQPSHC